MQVENTSMSNGWFKQEIINTGTNNKTKQGNKSKWPKSQKPSQCISAKTVSKASKEEAPMETLNSQVPLRVLAKQNSKQQPQCSPFKQ
eukprot:813271-Ditylum_brightwellii.AAC.1